MSTFVGEFNALSNDLLLSFRFENINGTTIRAGDRLVAERPSQTDS